MLHPIWTLGLLLLAAYWMLRIAVQAARIRADRWPARPELYAEPLTEPPSVSICVPARDEATVIGTCVHALLRQDYPNLREVLVVDDRSSDGTAEAARIAASGDPRLRVLSGDGPPPGWKGKQAALWRAQQEARGDWLLFVDADVVLHPRALAVAVAAARRHGAQMLSWLGQLETRTFWEHVLMPFIGDLIALSAPLSRVNDPARDDCLANGQFILVSRAAYDLVGGHAAVSVRDSVVDDVSLARAAKFFNNDKDLQPIRYVLLHSAGLMRVRMYDSLVAIWNGFAKNFYAAAKRRAGWLAILVFYLFLTSILPWLAFLRFAGPAGEPGTDRVAAAAALAAVAATVAYRWSTRRYNPQPLWSALLHPLAALLTAGIVTDSVLRGLGLRKAVLWKGREVS
jgi:glycosyltransferase involved in cell wall biosynthesis